MIAGVFTDYADGLSPAFLSEFGAAVAVLGGSYLVLVGTRQAFPFVAAWIKRVRRASS